MVSTLKSFLAVAVIASVACSAYAIRCYQCDSISSPKCGEKFEAEERNLLDCSRISPPRFLQNFFPVRNATGCVKKRFESVAGHAHIERGCYFGDLSNTQTGCQSDPSLPFVKQLSCDVCNDDKCNSASSTAPAIGALLLFFGLARLFA